MSRTRLCSMHCLAAAFGLFIACGVARAQQQNPPAAPPVGAPGAATNEELLKELQALKKQVEQVGELKNQVKGLQDQLKSMQDEQKQKAEDEEKEKAEDAPVPKLYPGGDDGTKLFGNDPRRANEAASGYGGGSAGPNADFFRTGSWSGGPSGDAIKLKVSYIYNKGGGAFQVADPDKEFTLKLQNQITFDGTFLDRQAMPTAEQGFNVPFQRTYLYGNITRYWEYQVAEEAFLGQLNLLDMWINVHYDDRIMFKAGRQLTPFLLEYWGFSPAWEPVITNSPLFQFAGRRQVGAMVWGKLFDYKFQYQAGIFNGPNGFFFDLDRNMDLIAAATYTPFKGDGIPWLDSLGFGGSVQTGWESYMLNIGQRNSALNIGDGAGEPTTGNQIVTSGGVPFYTYNDNVRAMGNRTKIAPHFFWLGRFSVQAEYMIQSRQLADNNTTGFSVMHGYYVNASYFLTGERYGGDGTGTYTPISPIRPLMPARGQWGPGAWEVAAQFSEVNMGTGDFNRGFVNPVTSANRLDQLMVGVNWWPNKWARLSFDWVYDKFNTSISLPNPAMGGPPGHPINNFNTFWMRMALFF